MPIYEYECEICGQRFERIQSMRDEPVRQCPECAGSVHKIFHPAGIIFKGSGWYITDSRKASSSAVTGDSKSTDKTETKASGETKTETATETKTETKAETKVETRAETKTETK
jgi:putative FmdB family regulatory protein